MGTGAPSPKNYNNEFKCKLFCFCLCYLWFSNNVCLFISLLNQETPISKKIYIWYFENKDLFRRSQLFCRRFFREKEVFVNKRENVNLPNPVEKQKNAQKIKSIIFNLLKLKIRRIFCVLTVNSINALRNL